MKRFSPGVASAGCVEGEIPEDLLHSGMTKRDMQRQHNKSLRILSPFLGEIKFRQQVCMKSWTGVVSAGCVEGEIPEDLLHSGMTKRDMTRNAIKV